MKNRYIRIINFLDKNINKTKVMNKEQIINEAHENYRKTILNEFFENTKELRKWAAVEGPGGYNRKEFINKCKTDPEFSEKWGLKIEERELSLRERNLYWFNNSNNDTFPEGHIDSDNLDKLNILTKLITITYKDTIIENYE